MKNILFVSSSLACGGAEIVLQKQCEILRKQSFGITILCTDNFGHLGLKMQMSGFDVKDISGSSNKNDFIIKYLLDNKPDIVYINNANIRLALKKTKHILGYRLIIHLHECLGQPQSMSNRMLKMYKPWIDDVVSPHPVIYEQAKLLSSANHIMLMNPIDRSFFDLRFARNKRNVVGFCGRIAPEKSLLTFARVIRLVKEEIPDVSVLLVGDSDPHYVKCVQYKNDFIEEMRGIPLEITGFTDRCAERMNKIKVAVLLSFAEGFSNFIWESTALGIPIVSTNVGSSYMLLDRSELLPVLKQGKELSKEIEFLAARLIVSKLKSGMSKLDKKVMRNKARVAHEDSYEKKFIDFLNQE